MTAKSHSLIAGHKVDDPFVHDVKMGIHQVRVNVDVGMLHKERPAQSRRLVEVGGRSHVTQLVRIHIDSDKIPL